MEREPEGVYERFLLRAVIETWRCRPENTYGMEEYKSRMEAAGFRNVKITDRGMDVIPGYVKEGRKRTREMMRVRGFLGTYGGRVIDYLMYQLYTRGLMTYVFVRAEK